MVMKKIAGYGAVTYTSPENVIHTGRFGEVVDIHPDDVKRLEKFGVFEEDSSTAVKEADLDDLVGEDETPITKPTARGTRKA